MERSVEYAKLQELTSKTLVLFGSSYVCKAAFSNMNYLKNMHQTRLLDSNLEVGLWLMAFNEIPDFLILYTSMQDQRRHQYDILKLCLNEFINKL